jgi:hypothetical protein
VSIKDGAIPPTGFAYGAFAMNELHNCDLQKEDRKRKSLTIGPPRAAIPRLSTAHG